MSDPRTYQRTGTYVSPEAMELQDEEYEEICTAWDAKVADEEAATAYLWPDLDQKEVDNDFNESPSDFSY